MTVTLQTVELIQPQGELDCSFFPDADLDAKIGGWLNQAKAKVHADTTIRAENHNEAARQWAYYLAFSYVAGRFAAMPNSVSVNSGADSVSYGQDRPAYWMARALAAKAFYDSLPSITVTRSGQKSMPIPVKVVW